MTDDLITTFNISLVVRGSVRETSRVVSGRANDEREDPLRYTVAKAKGVFRCGCACWHPWAPLHCCRRVIDSPSDMTSASIIRRIVNNRESFAAKHKRKAEAENQYYEQKKAVEFVAEV